MAKEKEFKMFSLAPTVRSNARISDLLKILIRLKENGENEFQFVDAAHPESRILRLGIIKEAIKSGFVASRKIEQNLREKIESNIELTDLEVTSFMEQVPQELGWDRRLSNYMNKLEGYGFAFRDYTSKKITVTPLGKFFLEKPGMAIIWAFANIPAFSPRRLNFRINKITPLGVVAEYLHQTKSKTISKHTFAILLSLHHMFQVKEIEELETRYKEEYKVITDDLTEEMSKETILEYVSEISSSFIFAGLFKVCEEGFEPMPILKDNLTVFRNAQYDAIKFVEQCYSMEDYVRHFNHETEAFNIVSRSSIETNEEMIKRIAKEYDEEWLKKKIISVWREEHYNIPNMPVNVKRYTVIEWLVALLLAKDPKNKVKTNMILNASGFPVTQAISKQTDIELERDWKKYNIDVTLISLKVQLKTETLPLIERAKVANVEGSVMLLPKLYLETTEFFNEATKDANIKFAPITFYDFVENYPNRSIDDLVNNPIIKTI